MITDEELKNLIQEVNENDDLNLNMQVYDIMKKIIDLPYHTTTSIANLINYNPNDKFVDPLTQGKVSFIVKEVCKKLNIKLEENCDSFGGLSYYNDFKKIV